MRLLFLPLVLLFLACAQPTEGPSEAEVKKEVGVLLDHWHQAAGEADFENYFVKMDSISVFIGTDASENWDKAQFQDFSKPYFDQGKAWDFKVLERNMYLSKSGEVVWFDELLNTWMGTCRGSGVLEKNANTWKIKHYVLSMTIPNDDVQKVIAVTKKRDSISQAKFKN